MGDKIKQMLKSTYELEGLLLLVESRGENTSDMILSIIKEKTDEVGQFANELCAMSNGDEEQMPVTPDKDIHFTDLSDDDNHVVVKDEDAVFNKSIYEGQDERHVDYSNELENIDTHKVEVEEETAEEPAAVDSTFQFYNGSDEEEETEPEVEMELVFNPGDEPTEDFEQESEEEKPVEEEVTTEEENEEEPEVEMELVFRPEDEYKEDFVEENEEPTENEPFVTEEPKEGVPFVTEMEEQPVIEEEEEKEEIVEKPSFAEPQKEVVTLDEAYIRDKSKLLRNAFSINDKFRFQRELFGNNATEMTDAINLADAMNSYSEAEEYFYEDLGWDKESEEVIEFMKIIKNHFL